MGSRGPVPIPSALKRAQGVRPARINAQEPRPARTPVEPPYELSEEVRAVWDRLAPDLERTGVLTAWDVDLFAEYCETVVLLRRAHTPVEAGLLVRGRSGAPVTNPAWRNLRDLVAQMRALAQEFGLTPSARSGLR